MESAVRHLVETAICSEVAKVPVKDINGEREHVNINIAGK